MKTKNNISNTNIYGYNFVYVTDLNPLRSSNGLVMESYPQDRFNNIKKLQLHESGIGPFCKFSIPNTYRKSGVYLLISGDDIRYVGECLDLSKRYNSGYGNISPRNCYRGGQPTNCRLNNEIYKSIIGGEAISLYFYETDEYKAIESRLRKIVRAPWNRV